METTSLEQNKFTHVIFDMDGLLLDTERIYTELTERVAAKFGRTYTWEIKVQLMGVPGKIGSQKAIDLMNLPITPDEYLRLMEEHKDELFVTANVLPGAERLVRHFYLHNIPMAVASGSNTKDFHTKTKNYKALFDLFPIIILGDNPDVKHGKPHPDQFLLTLSKFNQPCAAEKCLVFEDSPNGVLAANAAGMGVVMVPDERLEIEQCLAPNLILKSLEDFKPEDFGFPSF